MAMQARQINGKVLFCMAIFFLVTVNLMGRSGAKRLGYGAVRSGGVRPCGPRTPWNCLGKPANRYQRGCGKASGCRDHGGEVEISIGHRNKRWILPIPDHPHYHHHHQHHNHHHHRHHEETNDRKTFKRFPLIKGRGANGSN
ncbi:hypothetical protein L484_005819 [Morus notabilis]|uniref:Uncharacterized protein n=1 Tax=Morus notabilis TaxID=981085 RepID=W9RWH1_9ROSA|nr:hypothetical protein L484_005819 [Morus notabilis]